jgi:S-DNA-T family DNA segregation ATPase FtsK/SpoIIIE
MSRHGVSAAAPIGRLGTHIPLASLPVPQDGRRVVGVDDETLAPAVIEPRGALLVSGPPGSGRTTALATIAASARRLPRGRQLVLFAPRRSTIAATGLFDTTFTTADDAARGARQLTEAITLGSTPQGSLVVVVEMLAEFSGTSAEAELDRLVREALRADHFVIGESESSTWGQAYLLGAPFRAGRRGLLLVPGDMEGDTLLGTPLGRFRRSDLPPGRGYLVTAGRARRTQVAQPG